MLVKGANLGKVDVEFNLLSNFDWNADKEEKEIILYLENLYKSLENKKDMYLVNEFPVRDGKVIIKPGMINHRCSNDLDVLGYISKYGVLASEWFGILESEREACFCAFVSRLKNSDYKLKGDLAEDNYSRLNVGKDVLLFFDELNPVMKYLLHLDFFEYEKIKKDNKDKIPLLYTEKEIQIFDRLIEPISPGGKDMRQDFDYKTNYWSAIPAGIPSFLINGICVKNNNYSLDEIEEISKMFPNAVLFNSNLSVLCYSYNNELTEKQQER